MKRRSTKHNKNFQNALLERQVKAAEHANRLTVWKNVISAAGSIAGLLVAILAAWPY